MCYAIPGRVVEILGNEAVVDYSGQIIIARVLFPVEVGEYVYVSGKIIVEKIPKEDALKSIGIISDGKTNPEQYFFRYAFPCAHLKLERGDINQDQYTALEQRYLKDNPPSKEELEKVFAPGFVFIKQLAQQRGKNYWEVDILKEYWENEHNNIINRGEGNYKEFPESLKDLCRIHTAEIINIIDQTLIVKYENKTRAIHNVFFPEIKFGDKVKIHYAYAVEKV